MSVDTSTVQGLCSPKPQPAVSTASSHPEQQNTKEGLHILHLLSQFLGHYRPGYLVCLKAISFPVFSGLSMYSSD